MSKSSQNVAPKFDFTNIGRRWEKRFSHCMLEMSELSLIVSAPERENLTSDEQATLRLGRADASRRIRELDDERDALVAVVLVDIPRSWLTPDAPDNLDWSDVTSLDYIKDYNLVVQTLSETRSAKN